MTLTAKGLSINIQVKVIIVVVKKLKQLQIKPRKNSEASTGYLCDALPTELLSLIGNVSIFIIYTPCTVMGTL